MEIRHLKHFLALASERNFTKAAAREAIVQSGLSSSVGALERDLGVLLYVRNTRPVRLTAEGEALVPFARHTLDAADAAGQAVREAHGALSGRLRIGTVLTSGASCPLSEWLGEFAVDYPGIDIHVQQLPAAQMMRMISVGELDCVVGPSSTGEAGGLEVSAVSAERLLLSCRTDHPLAGSTVDIRELAGERFVETQPGWATRADADTAFAAAGVSRRIACEVGEWTMLLDLVRVGMGIAFLPEHLTIDQPDISTIEVTGVGLYRRIDLIVPTGHAATPAARRFANHVQRALSARAVYSAA
jgi:DNA-binding transcriptional LysR family regulator